MLFSYCCHRQRIYFAAIETAAYFGCLGDVVGRLAFDDVVGSGGDFCSAAAGLYPVVMLSSGKPGFW